MILMIFSHLIKLGMLLSSSCVFVLLLCLSQECNGRQLSSIDDHARVNNANLLSHPTIMGFRNNPHAVHHNLNLETTKKVEGQTIAVGDDLHKQTDRRSQNKKDIIKNQNLKKVKEEVVGGLPKSLATVTFRIPPKNKRVHQQPGFNLDYSPPKTHPPTHN